MSGLEVDKNERGSSSERALDVAVPQRNRNLIDGLSPMLGVGRLGAMLSRSVLLTASRFPFLEEVFNQDAREAMADRLNRTLRRQDAATAEDACAALLAIFLGLLETGAATDAGAHVDLHMSSLLEANTQLIGHLVTAQEVEEDAKDLRQRSSLAADVQRSMLPPPCRCPGLHVYSKLISRHDTGGDFFDILRSPGRPITFLVGDVMGKGAPAALIMVMALTHFRDLARTVTSPSLLLKAANQRLCESLRHVSIYNILSASVLSVDVKGMTASFSRAGHEGLLMFRAADRSVELLLPAGLLLGLRSSEEYPSMVIPLAPGDVLMLFTDGVSEARDAHGEYFGTDRLAEMLKNRTDPDLRDFGDHVIARVRQFEVADRLQDDVLLLLIEVAAPMPVRTQGTRNRKPLTGISKSR